MKNVLTPFASLTLVASFLVFAVAPASAQDARLRLNNLDALEQRATDSVDVTIDGKLLESASKFVPNDEAKAKDLLAGLKGIYVKSFTFETENQYSQADVESIRAQMQGPGWERLVGVRSKKSGENVDVFVMMSGGKVMGLAILSAEPKELTVVNIVGTIDLDRLSELDGDLSIPGTRLERTPAPAPKAGRP